MVKAAYAHSRILNREWRPEKVKGYLKDLRKKKKKRTTSSWTRERQKYTIKGRPAEGEEIQAGFPGKMERLAQDQRSNTEELKEGGISGRRGLRVDRKGVSVPSPHLPHLYMYIFGIVHIHHSMNPTVRGLESLFSLYI